VTITTPMRLGTATSSRLSTLDPMAALLHRLGAYPRASVR
jgi:hypothetical protein